MKIQKLFFIITSLFLVFALSGFLLYKAGLLSAHVATEKGQLTLLKIIGNIYPKALEKKDFFGNTPAHIATKKGHLEILKFIVSKVPKAFEQDNMDGNTHAHIAAKEGHLKILKFIVSKYPKALKETAMLNDCPQYFPIHFAVKNKHFEIIKFIVSKYPKALKQKDFFGNTPAHIAAKKGYLEIIKFIVSKYPKAFEQKNEEFSATPAYVAAEKGHLEVLKFIVSKYPKVLEQRSENDYGFMPAHIASLNGHLEVLKFIFSKYPEALEQKIEPGVFYKHEKFEIDYLPAHLAKINNHLKILKFIETKYPISLEQQIPKSYPERFRCPIEEREFKNWKLVINNAYLKNRANPYVKVKIFLGDQEVFSFHDDHINIEFFGDGVTKNSNDIYLITNNYCGNKCHRMLIYKLDELAPNKVKLIGMIGSDMPGIKLIYNKQKKIWTINLYNSHFGYWHACGAESSYPELILTFDGKKLKADAELMKRFFRSKTELTKIARNFNESVDIKKLGDYYYPFELVYYTVELLYRGDAKLADFFVKEALAGNDAFKRKFIKDVNDNLKSDRYWKDLEAQGFKKLNITILDYIKDILSKTPLIRQN